MYHTIDICTRFTFIVVVVRPHRSTTVAYCYRPSSVVCRSVCHSSEPYKNGWTDREAVWVEDSGWPKEPCIRRGSRSPYVEEFLGERVCPRACPTTFCRELCKKWLKRSTYRLVSGFGWAEWSGGKVALCQTRAMQPVATCRQSPYLHTPAIIVTSF